MTSQFEDAPEVVVFGEYLRERRKIVGISQATLARLIGCTEGYISLLERGKKKLPNTIFLIRLALNLRVPLADLLVENGLIEACDNIDDLHEAERQIQLWETSLDVKEAARVLRNLSDALLRHGKLQGSTRDLAKTIRNNAEFLYSFFFDPRKDKNNAEIRLRRQDLID